MTNKKENVLSRTSETTIGKTTYVVTSIFNENGRETADDKLLRLVTDRISNAIKNSDKVLLSGKKVLL